MMEMEAVRVLWGRSVSCHKLRYTVLLSDGDAKTFNQLTALKPYGEDFMVEKEECVNHVSKRLGTALRNVITDCKKKGVTLGGQGRGQLTPNAIRKTDNLLQLCDQGQQVSRRHEGHHGFPTPLLLYR